MQAIDFGMVKIAGHGAQRSDIVTSGGYQHHQCTASRIPDQVDALIRCLPRIVRDGLVHRGDHFLGKALVSPIGFITTRIECLRRELTGPRQVNDVGPRIGCSQRQTCRNVRCGVA
ncbi:hypothetical protein D3C85_1318220 [compost metagenome]